MTFLFCEAGRAFFVGHTVPFLEAPRMLFGKDFPPRPHQSRRLGEQSRQEEILQRDLRGTAAPA